MTDDRRPTSDEMIRRAREDLGASREADDLPAAVPAEPDAAPEPDPGAAPLPASEDRPVTAGGAARSRPRAGLLVTAAAGIAGMVVAGIVFGLARGDGGDAGREAYIEGVESGITEGMVTLGLDDATVSCVLGTIRASGAYDGLEGLSNDDIVTLATISPTAPLSDYPPEFRPVADALVAGMASCVDPSDLGGPGTATGGGAGLGDDPDLDRLWRGCETTGAEDCDLLFLVSPAGSDYEAFGATCGGRDGADAGLCMDLNGDGIRLAAWRSACAAGDNGSCDLLYQLSPVGSDDEAFGTRCGGRDEPGLLPCWTRLGPGTR